MKKSLMMLVAVIGFGIGANAQDVITLKNGNEVEALVQEVEVEIIKYKKFENQTGPTYTVTKSEVFMIKYQNGEKDVFQIENQTKGQQIASRQETDKNDTIFLLNGKQIVCNVINITESGITYLFAGESLTNAITKNIVKEIRFGSGRVQKFSELIVINGVKDWQKVQITTLQTDVEGLVRKGNVIGNVGQGHETIDRKMKQQAAKLGAHIIFMQGKNFTIDVHGMAYGYE